MLKLSCLATLRATGMLLATAMAACTQTSRHAEAATLRCDDLGELIAKYPAVHYSVHQITPEIRARTAEQFVESLDPSRTLLLKAEATSFKEALKGGFDDIIDGECTLLSKTYERILTSAQEDTQRARAMMTEVYSIDKSVKLVIDPDDRGYPEDRQARDKLGQALIHFQMANYIKGGVEMDKAKKQLVHRYELTEKRIKERATKRQLPEMFAEAFARALDPHTSYLSHDSLQDFQINMKLSLEGIGAALRSGDGFTYIESLIPGGGAEKSGKLRPKDKIIAVAQDEAEPVSTIDMALTDVVKLIRGKKGTKVSLTILREGAKTETFTVTIIRDKIDVKQQAAKLDIKERTRNGKKMKVGVLELPSFYGSPRDSDGRSSYRDVKKLLKEARQKEVDALVLDLSRNGGGYLDDAVRISGLFVREGNIVATRDTDGRITYLEDEDEDIEWSGPLTVLVSPMSASASEILAGALQAYGRAVVIGATQSSFGKGSVQTLSPVRIGTFGGSLVAMKVTTGMYFLPSGRSTQQTGVTVDIVIPSLLTTIEMGEKDLDYSLKVAPISGFRSSEVNSPGAKHWNFVDAAQIATLAQRSLERIKRKPAFKEIKEEIAKAKARKGVIDLEEFSKEAEKAQESEDEDEDRFKRMGETFLIEATDIALDLHGLQKARSRKLGATDRRTTPKLQKNSSPLR